MINIMFRFVVSHTLALMTVVIAAGAGVAFERGDVMVGLGLAALAITYAVAYRLRCFEAP